jgi:hypothetical protein
MTFSGLRLPQVNPYVFVPEPPLESTMSRFVAPLGFTLACAWVFTLFVLASH